MAELTEAELRCVQAEILEARRLVSKATGRLLGKGVDGCVGSLEEAWGLMAGTYAELDALWNRKG